MGKVLDTYNRYRELLFSGDFAHLTEVADEDFVETCVGLTGWTRGLDIAAANFAAGIGAAFTDLTAQEYDHIDWNFVRLQLLGEAPDLPTTPERRAVLAG